MSLYLAGDYKPDKSRTFTKMEQDPSKHIILDLDKGVNIEITEDAILTNSTKTGKGNLIINNLIVPTTENVEFEDVTIIQNVIIEGIVKVKLLKSKNMKMKETSTLEIETIDISGNII